MKTRSDFYCGIHKDETITNYCCLMDCQTPLCPECIDEHNKRHRMNSIYPEIDTLNRVSKMCEKKSTLVIDELRAMLERLNSTQCLDVDSVQNRAFKDLEAMKQRIIDQVSSFFNNLYEDFSTKLNGSVKKVKLFDYFCCEWDCLNRRSVV